MPVLSIQNELLVTETQVLVISLTVDSVAHTKQYQSNTFLGLEGYYVFQNFWILGIISRNAEPQVTY
jgi:hypothetical protein